MYNAKMEIMKNNENFDQLNMIKNYESDTVL